MTRKVLIATQNEIWENDDIEIRFLRTNKFYKVLSLVEASKAGIQILPTLLLLHKNDIALKNFIQRWKLPLMVRMDFQTLPKKKTLGGIPLKTPKVISDVSAFLIRKNCYPFFHPNVDRSEDIYSVGVMMDSASYTADIECVGEGFDASDLRLGQSIPHEHIAVDLLRLSVLQQVTVSEKNYLKSRDIRIEKIVKFFKYTEYANKRGVLLHSLDLFSGSINNAVRNRICIPVRYNPLTGSVLSSLKEIALLMRTKVIENLPASGKFVASLSYIPNKGWVLWDVYGEWYER